MKKLGQGWQYTAYDLGNGRVFKKSNAWIVACWVILKDSFHLKNHPVWRIPQFISGCRRKAAHSFEILQRTDMVLAWFANPKRTRGLSYEQDITWPIEHLFKTISTTEAKKIVDEFIVFCTKLLKYGLIEKSFNITKNFALDSERRMVLIDIGELVDDPAIIQKQRTKRAWAAEYVVGYITDDTIRRYFISEMDKHFGL